MRRLLSVLVLAVLAALTLPGCSALAQLLRTDTGASTTTPSAVGIYLSGDNNDLSGGLAGLRQGQAGSTSASAKADADGDQTSTATVPPEAVGALLDAAQALITAGNQTAAGAVLGVARDAVKAQAAPKPAAAPPVAPAPVPAAPTAPESPAAPAAPPAPAGGTAAPPVEPVK